MRPSEIKKQSVIYLLFVTFQILYIYFLFVQKITNKHPRIHFGSSVTLFQYKIAFLTHRYFPPPERWLWTLYFCRLCCKRPPCFSTTCHRGFESLLSLGAPGWQGRFYLSKDCPWALLCRILSSPGARQFASNYSPFELHSPA